MPHGWLVNGERWLGPKRGNPGSKDNREAQTQRQGAKRKLARAKARAARDAAGEVVKSGFTAKTSWKNQRLIALVVEAEQARQLAKGATAKAAAIETALQDVKEASRQVATAKRREADAVNYADRMYKRQYTSYRGPPFLA